MWLFLACPALALPRPLETVHPVWYISLDDAGSEADARLRHVLRMVKHVTRVDAIRATDLDDHIHGMRPDAGGNDERGQRGLGRLAGLVSHLAAMRSIAEHFASTNIAHDPLAIVVQDDVSLEFAQWWGRIGITFDNFVDAAPNDWQVLQLSPVADSAMWQQLDRVPIGAHPPRIISRWSAGSAPSGLGCYAVRASTAMYFTRTFWRQRRFDVLPFLADAQRRVDLATVYAEMFVFSRAVTYTALTSPVSYHLEGSWFTRGRTHDNVHAEICARAMLAARWRMWAATQLANTSNRQQDVEDGARERRSSGDSVVNGSTIVTSRALVRQLTRQRLNECYPTEERFRLNDAATQKLFEHLKRNLSGLRFIDNTLARKLSRRLV